MLKFPFSAQRRSLAVLAIVVLAIVVLAIVVLAILPLAPAAGLPAAWGQAITLADPLGDDDGPGSYRYPTDDAFVPGSFDLTELALAITGDQVKISVHFGTPMADPWAMGVGFSLQTIFVFIDREEGGHLEAPPGLNLHFAEGNGWETCILLSPQQPARLQREVPRLLGDMAKDVVIPRRVRGAGSAVVAHLDLAELGEGDPSAWGYQVAVLVNDNLPAPGLLFHQRIEQEPSRYRFSGAAGGCSPNVLDTLGSRQQLASECLPGGGAHKEATLRMVHPGLEHAPPAAGLREVPEAPGELLRESPSREPTTRDRPLEGPLL